MKIILPQIFLALLIFSGSAAAQDRTWERYSPMTRDWSVLAPGLLKPDAEALKTGTKKGTFSYADFKGFFAVVFRDPPRRFVPWGPGYSKYFDKVRDDAVRAAKGELVGDKEFDNGSFSGREVQIKFSNNTTTGRETGIKKSYRVERFRMFFFQKRLYLLLAVLPEEQVNLPEIDEYMNSFVAN